MVPYNNKEVSNSSLFNHFYQTACYICKENFDVTFDDEEEAWYFVSAKRIRTNVKDQTTGQ